MKSHFPIARSIAQTRDVDAHGNPSDNEVRAFLQGCICAACHAPDTTGGAQGWYLRRDGNTVTFVICGRCAAAVAGSEAERERIEQAIFAEFDRPDMAGRFFAQKSGVQS